MKGKRIAIAVLLLAGAAAVAWWSELPARFGWTHEQADRLLLYGNVDIRQVQLGFRVGGRVADTLVDEGDSVQEGSLIARLDPEPYKERAQATSAQLAARAATLAKLEAGPRAAEIAQGRAVVAERAAELENVRLAFERAKQLRPGGAISQAALDQAHAAKDMAAARLASAQGALRLLEEGTRAEDIAEARAAVQEAEANLASARTSIADTRLTAPAAGVILSRVRERGAIVAPGDIIFVLSLSEPVWVRAYIAEPNLGRIHPGMEVEVVSDSAPDRPYRGHIGFISPVAEFTPKSVETPELRTDLVYRLRVIVDEADESLRQGMPVTVRIPMDRQSARAGS